MYGGSMAVTTYSNRILSTPSTYAKEHFLYVQEIGTLTSLIPHTSSRKNLNSLLFFVVLEGAGNLTYENQTFSLQSGDCVWLDCSRPYSHESSVELPWTLMWVHFWGKEAAALYQNFIERDNSFLFRPGNTYPFKNTLTRLYREQSRKDSLSELVSHNYLTDIITSIYLENDKHASSSLHIPEKFMKIRAYLDEHYPEKLELETISNHFYISKYHLSREFKRIFGTTIGEYLLKQRISKSKSLLRFSDLSVDEIALQCGFSDSGYFIKVFKKEEKTTPAKYRKLW